MSAALQFKGTPGQWRAVEESFGGEWVIRGEPNGEWIDGKPVDQSPVIAEIVRNKADAHLLAAAPKLLKSLRAILAQIDPENTPIGLGNILNAHAAIEEALKP